jgi:hypothetical protein
VRKTHNWGFLFGETGGGKTHSMTQNAQPAQAPADGDVTQAPEAGLEGQAQPATPSTPADGADPGGDGQTPGPDPIEQLATELGWNPNHAGPGAVDARTYILRSREINDGLSKRVRNMSKEMAALREGIDTVRWTAEQSAKREVSRLKAELADVKAQKDAALGADVVDPAAIRRYDSRIEELQATVQQQDAKPPEPAKPASTPEFDDWLDDNKWYATDADLQQYANNLSHLPEYQAMSYAMRLDRVAAAVKTQFPDRFKATPAPSAQPASEPATDPSTPSPSSSAGAAVSPSRQRPKPTKTVKATADDLSFHERKVGESFVSMGIYKDLNDYAQKLAEKEHADKTGGPKW